MPLGKDDVYKLASKGSKQADISASNSDQFDAAVGGPYRTSSIIKLPTFTPESPDLFFLLIEAALKQEGVIDPNKIFLQILMQLPQRVQIQAKYLLNTIDPDKVNKLKNIVYSLYNLSEEERLKKLLSSTSLGDMRPSEYLRHIRELQGANTDPNSSLIRTYFLQSLPDTIASFAHLMSSSHSLDEIAAIADKSASFCRDKSSKAESPINSINAIETPSLDVKIDNLSKQINSLSLSATQRAGSEMPYLESMRREFDRKLDSMSSQFNMQISALSAQIAGLQQMVSQNQRFSGNRLRMRSRSSSRSNLDQNQINQNGSFCYYHARFGERATRCTQPCNYSSGFNHQGNS